MADDGSSYGGSGSKKSKKKLAKPAQDVRDLPAGTKNINFDWDDVLGVIREHVSMFKVEDLIIQEKVNERELICLVNKGPVAVSIDVHSEFTNFQGDGIYPGPKKKRAKIDKHLLLVRGYGTKMPEGIHYWKVQNSAGHKWGDKGLGKIVRQISRGKNEPSLFTCIVYPTLLDHYEGERIRQHA
ncbi:PREDICTED: cathepsin 7-like [Camelina sativa]|uniref:Cathepsin 7-like n=1 Tax=Camelina sativa TaxID=90675 RepID=A0ABM1Q7L9_CAMSA|nr:PREDICTED: cathepsin 7-like [Camelina sativa]